MTERLLKYCAFALGTSNGVVRTKRKLIRSVGHQTLRHCNGASITYVVENRGLAW